MGPPITAPASPGAQSIRRNNMAIKNVIPKTKPEQLEDAAASAALAAARAAPATYSTTAADLAAVLVALGVMAPAA